MLVRLKVGDDFICVNPDRVFCVGERNDGRVAIRSDDEKNYVIVDGPLDLVAMRLNDAMRR